MRPFEARTAYLNGQSPEKKAEMIARADAVGPGKDDADWLVALAASDAASRIEAAAPMTQKALADFAERLERVEQGVDDLKKQKAIPGDLAPQMARLEALLRSKSQQVSPFAGIIPVVLAFVAGAAVVEAAFFALSWRWLPPTYGTTAAFVCGLSATAFALLWLWLYPHVVKRRR